MSSSLTWVDYDSKARERSLRILALFQEKESRDELGLGGVRDAFSDRLFPGTSTIQTRLKYMLIVPWVYRQLEEKRVPASDFYNQARKLELRIVNPLLENDDRAGVFGKTAGKGLKRLPSSVYWAGLGVWGIRRIPLSQDEYHRGIDRIYRARDRRENQCRAEAALQEEPDSQAPPLRLSSVTWHPQLPGLPEGFPDKLDLSLSAAEAQFLLDCICSIKSEPDSLLKHLALNCQPVDTEFAWEHPDFLSFQQNHKELLTYARLFSDVMHGAAILYNIMLAELSENEGLTHEHLETFRSWKKNLDLNGLTNWQLARLWELTGMAGHTITSRTRDFVARWVDLAISQKNLNTNTDARNLVKAREIQLKQARSRFRSQKARDNWSGYSGLSRLSFRWSTAKTFLKDLHDGLSGAHNASA